MVDNKFAFDIVDFEENVSMDVLLFLNLICLGFVVFNITKILKHRKNEHFRKGKISSANIFLFSIILCIVLILLLIFIF